MSNNTQKIINLIIVDESGSMSSIAKPTISGFEELLSCIRSNQERYPNQEHYISFVTFNSQGIKYISENSVPIKCFDYDLGMHFEPSGLTPLNDAIGQSVMKLKLELKNQENYNVLVTILTDGEENCSNEFTNHSIRSLINELKVGGNWAFSFIGTDFDVEKSAIDYGIDSKRVMAFAKNEKGVKDTFDKIATSYNRLYSRINIGGKADDWELD